MKTDTIVQMAIDYSVRIGGVLLVLWVAAKVAARVQDIVTRRLTERGFDNTLSKYLANMAKYAILGLTLLSCLGVFGIETTSFAAVIGAAGLAIGLAFQGSLSNVASGVMLVSLRPFKTGDLVEVNGITAVVKEIGLLTTTLNSPNNVKIVMPNRAITGTTIQVFTGNPLVRICIPVGTEYSANLDKTREVLQAAANGLSTRSPDKEPEIFISSLGASSVDWEVRIWADPFTYWDVWEETTRATKVALDAAGIGIPYQTIDVNLAKS